MFWKKKIRSALVKPPNFSYPGRNGILFISEVYKQILFVPQGISSIGLHAEIDAIEANNWPCDFGQLQLQIEAMLNKYQPTYEHIAGNWPSFEHSQAKTRQAFKMNYLNVHLRTDMSAPYREGEAERIITEAWPNELDTSYRLTGTQHLVGTQIAQTVCDIAAACFKIRN